MPSIIKIYDRYYKEWESTDSFWSGCLDQARLDRFTLNDQLKIGWSREGQTHWKKLVLFHLQKPLSCHNQPQFVSSCRSNDQILKKILNKPKNVIFEISIQ